jgi:DNA-binding CsgD family transcriptional regulator
MSSAHLPCRDWPALPVCPHHVVAQALIAGASSPGCRVIATWQRRRTSRRCGFDEIGQRLGVAVSLEALGGLAADEGRPEHAVRLLAAARAYRKEGVGHIRPSAEQATFDADLASVQQGLSPEAFAAAWEQGLGLSLSEAVAYAAKGRGPRQRPTTGWASLTKAERDVALLAAEGLTNTEIGQRLFISPRTAKAHLGHIFAKLGVTSRRQLPREGQPRA